MALERTISEDGKMRLTLEQGTRLIAKKGFCLSGLVTGAKRRSTWRIYKGDVFVITTTRAAIIPHINREKRAVPGMGMPLNITAIMEIFEPADRSADHD